MDFVGTALAEMTMPQISPLAGEPIDRADAERLAGVLKALADPARLRLLSLIFLNLIKTIIAPLLFATLVVGIAGHSNLRQVGLYKDDDRLRTQKNPRHTKVVRRGEVISGKGECAWSGQPMRIVAFIGDQMTDFPESDEGLPDTGTDAAFGRTCFLLPNSMYGAWTTRATRLVP